MSLLLILLCVVIFTSESFGGAGKDLLGVYFRLDSNSSKCFLRKPFACEIAVVDISRFELGNILRIANLRQPFVEDYKDHNNQNLRIKQCKRVGASDDCGAGVDTDVGGGG